LGDFHSDLDVLIVNFPQADPSARTHTPQKTPTFVLFCSKIIVVSSLGWQAEHFFGILNVGRSNHIILVLLAWNLGSVGLHQSNLLTAWTTVRHQEA